MLTARKLSYCLLFALGFLLYAHVLFAQADSSYADEKDTSAHPCTGDPYLKPPVFIIPGIFFVYSGLKSFSGEIQKFDDSLYTGVVKNHASFHTNAEDYLMWSPSAAVYIMDALHLKTQHNFKEHLILDASSILITGGVGYAMRLISKQIPAYTAYPTKFPSGHTANAFRSAEFLHQELKHLSPVVSYSGYVIATTVGILRIYNKDHLLSEVVTGAGLGILSTKFTYWLFDKIRCKRKRMAINRE
ncbi:MAG TPA: phosphatase PAP2 family protein [Chitinophagaceae bacterium]|nr:phosphatase PAP2 family protein [Chitinophagaceae bacterium]